MRHLGPGHFKRHARFYVAALLGVVIWLAGGVWFREFRLSLAADSFFFVYLVLTMLLAARATPAELRQLSTVEDEGILVIVIIALAAVVLSMAAIFSLVDQPEKPGTAHLLLALLSAPLGWCALHMIAAMHYAHRYYVKDSDGSAKGGRRDRGGLKFPDTAEPQAWDFIYFSFVVGMTAQVSDVAVTDTAMRRLVTAQGLVSFLFNTVLIALAVNVAVAVGH